MSLLSMKTLLVLVIFSLMSGAANAQPETKKAAPLKNCVGLLHQDGSVEFKEDCLGAGKKMVKKGIRKKLVTMPIDTPERAMELYNKTKDEAITIERDDEK